jgi:hypothetical protein
VKRLKTTESTIFRWSISSVSKIFGLIESLFVGSGAFSEVFKVKRKSDKELYALKKVNILVTLF